MTDESYISDSVLIRRCRAGDDAAFKVLYFRYRLRLYSYINKQLRERRDLADDIFQQVWLKVLTHWNGYDDRQRFLAWICRIAHNLMMDMWRSISHNATVELGDGDWAEESSSALAEQDRAKLEQVVENVLATLPQNQREVFEYRRAGRSFNEIMEIQKCPLNTVLGRMRYAVKKIRDGLKDFQ